MIQADLSLKATLLAALLTPNYSQAWDIGAIVPGDLKWYLSGGSGNSDPDASLGGAISTTEIVTASDNNVFDDTTGDQASSGVTKYRGIYFKNTHGTITLQNAKVWIESDTTSADDALAIALPGEGLNATIETIADENTAPSGETFSAPANKAAGLSFGNIPAGQYYGLWLRIITNASASAVNANTAQIKVEGDTTAS